MPERKKRKGETGIRKMRCDSLCVRKGSTAECSDCLEGVALNRALQPHFMHSW